MRFVAIIFAAFLFLSCSSVQNKEFAEIREDLNSGEYQNAYSSIEEKHEKLYGNKDEVIRSLDKGMVAHFAGEYKASNRELAIAEQKIYDFFSKSISQSVSSYIMNDTIIDYSGETYEDIYTNIFMALNYIHQNKIEDAFVEIRRFDNKLKNVSLQYSDLITQANQVSKKEGGESIDVPDLEFHNSALARYLSMILYRSENRLDSAEVDQKYLKSAFKMQPDLYDFPIPSCVETELSVPKDMARLNILAFSGLSPFKEEEVTRVRSPDGVVYYKIALPVMQQSPSIVNHAIVTVYDSEGNTVASSKMEKIESIEKIAMDTFEQKKALLYLKASTRALAKAAATTTFGSIAKEEDSEVGMVFALLHLSSVVTTEITEQADTRISRFFPATAWVSGINVPVGDYTVSVEYKKANGSTIKTDNYSVNAQTSSLNLLESVCLK